MAKMKSMLGPDKDTTPLGRSETAIHVDQPTSTSGSLDPDVGGTYRGKPIWDLTQIEENLNRTGNSWYKDNYGELDDGVLNFGFWSSYKELASSYYVNNDGSIAFNEAYYKDAFSVFSVAQVNAARTAIGLWGDLIDVKFQETSATDADITYGNTDTGSFSQAYAYLPFGSGSDEYYAQFGFHETGRLGGDVWVNNTIASNFFPLGPSYYGQTTLIHETGHALGLSHPGDYNAGQDGVIDYVNSATYAQDSLQYSIMSYFDGYETGAQFIDWSLLNFAYPSTPMIHDIAAIQAIYGANYETRSGDTTYGFHSNTGKSAYNFTVDTRPVISIWDGGGHDTLDFSGWNTDSVINLNAGSFSSGGGSADFETLEQVNANRAALGFAPRTQEVFDYYESLKEQLGLTSSLFKDNISIAYGVTIEDAVGGGGNDLIYANEVANRINGNAGIDTVSYAYAVAAVAAGLDHGGIAGFAKGDTYVNIENLTGSAFSDALVGNEGANLLTGVAGNDTLDGQGGADTALGGNGNDSIVGGTGNDSLIGDIGNDTIVGGDGNDYAHGGRGVDSLYGGNGSDTLDGGTGADVLQAGSGNDLLIGNTGEDILHGGNGADTLIGGDDNDTLWGESGPDVLTGGKGSDVFAFNHTDLNSGLDAIGDFKRGSDKIDLTHIDANAASKTTIDAFHFIGSAAFSGEAGELRTYSDHGVYYVAGDTNGDGHADLLIALTGTSSTYVSAADFILA